MCGAKPSQNFAISRDAPARTALHIFAAPGPGSTDSTVPLRPGSAVLNQRASHNAGLMRPTKQATLQLAGLFGGPAGYQTLP